MKIPTDQDGLYRRSRVPVFYLFGALLIGVLLAGVLVPIYGYVALKPTNSYPALNFDPKDWVVFYGVLAAMSGWIIGAIVQIRNSIKQYTITVLINSRLSTAFQEKSTNVLKVYWLGAKVTPDEMKADRSALAPDKAAALEGLRYFLNYYEFIAVGIRAGDFNEALMFASLRQIVVNLCNTAEAMIAHHREMQPRSYANLRWLHDHWVTMTNPATSIPPQDQPKPRHASQVAGESKKSVAG